MEGDPLDNGRFNIRPRQTRLERRLAEGHLDECHKPRFPENLHVSAADEPATLDHRDQPQPHAVSPNPWDGEAPDPPLLFDFSAPDQPRGRLLRRRQRHHELRLEGLQRGETRRLQLRQRVESPQQHPQLLRRQPQVLLVGRHRDRQLQAEHPLQRQLLQQRRRERDLDGHRRTVPDGYLVDRQLVAYRRPQSVRGLRDRVTEWVQRVALLHTTDHGQRRRRLYCEAAEYCC